MKALKSVLLPALFLRSSLSLQSLRHPLGRVRRSTFLCDAAGGAAAVPSSFDEALAKLSEPERYNAVLQGVLSRDSPQVDDARAAVREAEELLSEMTQKRIRCSDATLRQLIDTAAAAADPAAMSRCLEITRQNGVTNRFASDMARLTLLPSDARRRSNLLLQAPELPEDNREAEVAVGGTFALFAGSAVVSELFAPLTHQDTLLPGVTLLLLGGGYFLDIFRGGNFSDIVTAGLTRLTLRDPERECDCESASFLIAYLSGLPSFAYSPNVVEAAKLVEDPELAKSLGGSNGVHRLLVWLLAASAAESLTHQQLIVSDPRQALALLKLLRERDIEGLEAFDADEDAERVRWAFGQARTLLRQNSYIQGSLKNRMESGAASVGDCVALIENAQS